MPLRDALQELRELGVKGAAFRAGWEMRTRVAHLLPRSEPPPLKIETGTEWTSHLPLEDPISLARWMRPLISSADLATLRQQAKDGTQGRVFGFSRRFLDFGWPIQWHRNPTTGRKWPANVPWSEALMNSAPGDVKDVWEIARFPHAYHFARAAAFFPEDAEMLAGALVSQIQQFIQQNPVGRGVHWSSGQEVGFRLLAWLFALDVLLLRTRAGTEGVQVVRDALVVGATEIERHLDYARIAVYNNHLLSEALALFGVGALLPEYEDGTKWREMGRRILDEQAEAQFYRDGAYIQQSHNYHRVALQNYLWACIFARSMGDSPSQLWLDALSRSLDFLYQHQNPGDGRLPNYGANDGSVPSILTTCEFSDFRPVLQAVSLLVRGERIYEPGPWDETPAWFLGVRTLDAPQRSIPRASVAFSETGYFVTRGTNEDSFAAFRCGSLRDRFSQIDMLHTDVWWKGLNVLVDGGTFRYNAADTWHDHFMRMSSHNTVKIDDRDQMLHYRRFKVLYWTKAKALRFDDDDHWTIVEGEHYGYRRHSGGCIHRRSLMHVKNGFWIVVDTVLGSGSHSVELQWLGGDFPWAASLDGNGMSLVTPKGTFDIRTFSENAQPIVGDVQSGIDPEPNQEPRGWLSRYYGERVAVPSFRARLVSVTPVTFVSLLGEGIKRPSVGTDGRWRVADHARSVMFTLSDGRFSDVTVARCTS